MPSTRLGATALAVLAVLTLSAGPAAVPSSADGIADGVADGVAAAVTAPDGARVQVVRDPRGDVIRKPQDVRGAFEADLTSVRYRTPSRIGGELRITSRWARLWNGRREGNPGQLLWTEFVESSGTGSWTVYVGNDGDVLLEDYTGDEGYTVIVPERAEVDLDVGLDGRMDLRMSTEWMRDADPRRVEFTTWAGGSFSRPRDPVARSRPLRVGEAR
ncbi:hypothetical protein [uncultured Nocardioides sp.]|uniref:hypothetical protein n=1 Tax=uncultured Nocardioides sp. TaxID=198441 RepID=UPI0026106D43|nr:hypothetical protein [uncultured Nocardioides sp.]